MEEQQLTEELANISRTIQVDIPEAIIASQHDDEVLSPLLPEDPFQNQQTLIYGVQAALIVLLGIKYFFPRYQKNTHSKVLSFLFVISALNLYKQSKSEQKDHSEFGHWALFAIQIVQALLHCFKVSSFKRNENRVVEKVNHMQGSNLDRVFQLCEHPSQASNMGYVVASFLVQGYIVILNLLMILSLHGVELVSSVSLPHSIVSSLLPFDLSTLSVFLTFHLALTEYVGLNEWDRAQYFAIRVLPFLTLFLEFITSVKKTVPPEYKLILGFLACIQMIYFIFTDWGRAVTSPFSDLEEQFESENPSYEKGKTKKVIIENSGSRLKMIIYRERRDGGIQGILIDFYIDLESGMIANEFLRIHEREDGEVDLVKVEKGIKPIEDKREIERVFKQLFLKSD